MTLEEEERNGKDGPSCHIAMRNRKSQRIVKSCYCDIGKSSALHIDSI